MSKTCDNCESKGIMEEKSLAMQVLEENTKQAKRWYITAMVELGIIVSIIAGAFYCFLTTEIVSYDLSTEGGGHANCVIDSKTGDVNNGTSPSETRKTEK